MCSTRSKNASLIPKGVNKKKIKKFYGFPQGMKPGLKTVNGISTKTTKTPKREF